jgi:hypothetical protein
MTQTTTDTLNREASELGLLPGNWPVELTIDGTRFYRVAVKRDADFDVVYVRYEDNNDTRQLRVWND